MPQIRTPRLLLRPFADGDAAEVQRLAGDARVADTTLTVPHPYPDGVAEMWIAGHAVAWEMGRGAVFAITLAAGGRLVGAIGLTVKPEDRAAELGYWVGVPYWGHGYCTEAARALIDFGFTALPIGRVHAHHFARNPASGRVMLKSGMTEAFFTPRAIEKRGVWEDVRGYTIMRDQWWAQRCRDEVGRG